MATESLEDRLKSMLKKLDSQEDVLSFLDSKQGKRVKKLFEQAFDLSKDILNVGDLTNDKVISILSLIASLYPNDTSNKSSNKSSSNENNSNNNNNTVISGGLRMLHSFFTFELLLVGCVAVFAPKLLLTGLNVSEPYNASVNEDNSNSQYQFIRIMGALCICLAVHYMYESNDLNGIKGASLARIVFGTIVTYMIKKQWVEKPLSVLSILETVGGLAGFWKSKKLESKL